MVSFLRAFLLTGLPIFLLVVATDYFWRKNKYQNELTRKFIHITVGTYAAFWPWFISWGDIELLALGALCALILSYTFNIFKSVHLARRYGTGEYLSAISIALVAIITHDHLLFAAAVLHLSLADGIAAVIGTRFGKGNIYHIFGQRKSLIGTSTFWLCSVIILAIVFSVGHISGIWPALLWLPLVATALENIGIYGTDNLLVPVAVVLILRALI